jgi:hypothetical protein
MSLASRQWLAWASVLTVTEGAALIGSDSWSAPCAPYSGIDRGLASTVGRVGSQHLDGPAGRGEEGGEAPGRAVPVMAHDAGVPAKP